jgi:hypothetical protein
VLRVLCCMLHAPSTAAQLVACSCALRGTSAYAHVTPSPTPFTSTTHASFLATTCKRTHAGAHAVKLALCAHVRRCTGMVAERGRKDGLRCLQNLQLFSFDMRPRLPGPESQRRSGEKREARKSGRQLT